MHVANGVLTLHAERRSCTDEQGITHPYASGMVTTGYSKFLYTYGLLEVRVWLPPGETQTPVDWPGVWESGANFPQDGELDIMEVQGRRLCWRFHYSSGAPSACPAVPEVGGWHVFSADWEPTYIKFYYDGQRVGKVTSGVTNAPMKINIDLALSSNIVVPVDVKVEYVRLWKPD